MRWSNWRLTKLKAEEEFLKLNEQSLIPAGLDERIEKLRSSLLEVVVPIREQYKDKLQSHSYDYQVGMAIYILLRDEFSFHEREAAQNELWYFLSIKVIPDLVEERFGLNANRFYNSPRRIWLKTIWWYIHLSWQGDRELTMKILENNSTDDIVQLVERSGRSGYRVDFSRDLMSYYSTISNDVRGRSIFRRVMKLNTARIKTVEPNLMVGGNEAYVKALFDYFQPNHKSVTNV